MQLQGNPEACGPQCLLIHAADTAVGNLSVNCNGGDFVDAEFLCPPCAALLFHVMDRDFAGRASDLFHECDCFIAADATRSENFHVTFLTHLVPPLPVCCCGSMQQHGFFCGQVFQTDAAMSSASPAYMTKFDSRENF